MWHEDDAVAYVTIDGEEIETTPWHLFYTDEGWQEAEDLAVGELVLSLDGEYVAVESIVIEADDNIMYDLTVEEVHNFAVGDGQWVVHNECLTTGSNHVDFRRAGTASGMTTKYTDDNATVRVGRWMSQEEYDLMIDTGIVQAGSGGESTYGLLDGPDSFSSQATSGSVYIEFDIPVNSAWWVTNDTLGWITIPSVPD